MKTSNERVTKNGRLSFRKIFQALFIVSLIVMNNNVFSQTSKSIYFIGNSVTDAINYDGLKSIALSEGNTDLIARHMIPGTSLSWLWDHPQDGFFEAPYGNYSNALGNYTWDYISLQPFDRNIDGSEGDRVMCSNFINAAKNKSPNGTIIVYSRWPRSPYGDDITNPGRTGNLWNSLWLRSTNEANECRKFFEDLTVVLRNDFSGRKIILSPVGEVFYQLNVKMMNGQVPGFSNIWQVYSDGIHLAGVGSYIAALTYYSAIHKADPRGVSVPSQFGIINASVVSVIQQTVWEVVTSYKDANGLSWSDFYDSSVSVTGVTLNQNSIALQIGSTSQLTATVTPANATNKSVTWVSSNTGIVSINSTGLATGVAAGTAIITCTTVDGNKNATCTITVSSAGETEIASGRTATASSNYGGWEASKGNDNNTGTGWSSADGNALPQWWKVDLGSAQTISKSVITFEPGYSARYKIEVSSDNSTWTSKVDKTSASFGGIQTDVFSATNVRYIRVTITSSSDGYAYFMEFKAYKPGSTISVTGVTLDKTSMILNPSATSTLVANVIPIYATNKTVTWTSSNTAVATVDATGKVTAVAPGNATITVKTSDGNFTSTCSVRTNAAPTAVLNATPVSGAAPLVVSFNAAGSTDPNADDFILGYDWDFGDGSAHANSNAPSHTYAAIGTYTATLRVMDNRDFYSAPVTKVITVSGTGDLLAGYTYSCGEYATVNVTGTMDIAYGANGSYKYLYNQTANVGCDNNTFGGDPIFGVAKSCYTKTSTIITNTITARGQNTPNEGIDKLTDGNKFTKWLDFSATSWIQFQYSNAKTWNKYEITSGNDEPGRDPKNWTIKGSNNGTTWTTLCTETNQTWAARNETKAFLFSNSTPYSYYRFEISANNGAAIIQMSELTFSSGIIPPIGSNMIGIGIGGKDDYDGIKLYADAFRNHREWTKPGGGEPNTDVNYWPLEDASTVVWHGISNMNGTYKLSFTGNATVTTEYGSASVQNKLYDAANNKTTADIIYNSTDGSGLKINFTGTSGGVKNVKLMRPVSIGSSTSYTTEYFTNQAKTLLNKFSVIRFLDFVSVNGCQIANWSDRTLPSYSSPASRTFGTGVDGSKKGAGAPWEDAIQLCNELDKDMWVNIPHKATSDYIRQLAILLKNNLETDRKIYIEYSNEVWNTAGGFDQSHQNKDAALSEVAAGGSPLNFDGLTDGLGWDYGMRRVGLKIVEASNIFRSVFGDAAMMTKVRPVLMSQLGYPGGTLTHSLNFISDYFNNPAYVQTPHPPKYFLYGAGGSAYYGEEHDASVDEIFNSFPDANYETDLKRDMNYCASFGLKRIAYEGGPSLDPTYNDAREAVRKAAWNDPRMKTAMVNAHNIWSEIGGDLLVYYVARQGHEWGFFNDIDDLSHPKIQAIDELNATPKAALTYGNVPPFNIDGKAFSMQRWDWVSPGTGSQRITPIEWVSYVFRVTTAGNYNVSIDYSNASNSGLRFLLDGTEIGGETLGSNGTSSTFTLSNLQVGTHAIMVKSAINNFDVDRFKINTGAGTKNIVDASPNNINNQNSINISVYPNPAKEFININMTSANNSNAIIRLTDISGKLVLSETKSLSEGNNSMIINTCDLNSGLYILKIQNGNEILNEKILINK